MSKQINTFPPSLPNDSNQIHWPEKTFFGDDPSDGIHCYLHNNYSTGMHTHDFYEINIVLNGMGRHYVEDRSCDAGTGSVFVIPPNVSHGYYPMPELDVFHILISRRFLFEHADHLRRLDGFAALFEIEPMLRSMGTAGKSSADYVLSLFPVLKGERFENLKSDVKQLLHVQDQGEPDLNFIKAARTLSIIAYMCECMDREMARSTPKLSGNTSALMQALEKIHTDYSKKLSVNELASLATMSRSTFFRHFKRLTGMLPQQYITDFRIRKAKEMLRMSDMQITNIATECGFYDASHFNKCFLMAVGLSPKEYRISAEP